MTEEGTIMDRIKRIGHTVAKLALLLVFVLSALGCAVKTPSAKISSVEVNDVTTKKIRLRFVVKVHNPNDVDITVKKISYTLLFFDEPVLKDKIKKKIVIPKKTDSYFKFPVTVQYSDLISAGITALGKNRIEYTLAAKITVDTPVGDQTLPMKKSGTIKVKNVMDIFGKEEGPGTGSEIPFFDAGSLEVNIDPI